jgi:hypothetical protein
MYFPRFEWSLSFCLLVSRDALLPVLDWEERAAGSKYVFPAF